MTLDDLELLQVQVVTHRILCYSHVW